MPLIGRADERSPCLGSGSIVNMTANAASPVALDDLERKFLRAALLDWGGPARPTDAIAVALGFSSANDISAEAWELWKRIDAGEALEAQNWRRVLLAAEVIFASDVVGSGIDWSTTSGISDVESIEVLRGPQRKLPRWRECAQFSLDETGHVKTADPDRPQP